MRKVLLMALVIVMASSSGGCWGPNQWSRSFGDWNNQMYVDSPWVSQVLLYTGVYPIGWALTFAGDLVLTNTIDFWSKSAFSGKGTPFIHTNPTIPLEKSSSASKP